MRQHFIRICRGVYRHANQRGSRRDRRRADRHYPDGKRAPDRFQRIAEFTKSIIRVVGFVRRFFDLVPEAVRFLFRALKFIADTVDGFFVVFELALHIVQLCLRVIQLHRPLLRSLVVFTERFRRILQRTAKQFYLILLLSDLTGQHFVAGGERGDAAILFVELGFDQLHLGAEYFELLVDIPQSGLELTFAFDTNLQAKIRISHVLSSFLGK
ncbi:hypothetical protein SDC9_71633 [bioreactor metagenome]|uniref:Uncharacterized protein n=1 Tax=bioreactor metagenome TaxID=1076179 RepID=A0A644YF33_9ZZZZ